MAIDANGTNKLIFLQQRHRKQRARAKPDQRGTAWQSGIGRLRLDVRDLFRLFAGYDAAKPGPRSGRHDRIASPCVDKLGRGTMDGYMTEGVSLAQEQVGAFGFTDAGSVSQHRLEHRRKLAQRTTNDAQ